SAPRQATPTRAYVPGHRRYEPHGRARTRVRTLVHASRSDETGSKTEGERPMLGEQIGEENGRVTVRRVISVDGGTKVEVTVQGTGKLLGVETRNEITYCAAIRPDGSLYGEALGLVMGKGGELATFKAAGVGRLLDSGAVSYRGASYYYSDSPNFRRLNTV